MARRPVHPAAVLLGLLWGALLAAPLAGQACVESDFDPRAGPASGSTMVPVGPGRMHVLECGDGAPVVFVHGQPTSTWLWRDVVPSMTGQGRAHVVDLLGFGRSDRPAIAYSAADHERAFAALMERLGEEPVVLVGHDWGSYFMLGWAARNPGRVRGLVLMEGILPVGLSRRGLTDPLGARADSVGSTSFCMAGLGPGGPLSDAAVTPLALGDFLRLGTVRTLSADEHDGYAAPFDGASRAAVGAMPRQIPEQRVLDEVFAYAAWLESTDVPLLYFAVEPGVLAPPEQRRWVEERVTNLTVVELGAGVHFVQEDHGRRIGAALADWLARLGR